MRVKRLVSALLLAMAISPAIADDWLSQIRNTDLNDYALGLAVTASDSPYLDQAGGAYAYPYLTAFTQSFFTDDWLLIRDGDVGIRWTRDDWEFGVLGRVNTQGIGADSSEALAGLRERKWTTELAPMVGFRRWSVQLNARLYTDILRRHGSFRGVLSISYPWQGARGYFVPSIDVIYASSDCNDYYYGIDDAEVTPTRSAYTAGSSISEKIRVRYGYELTDSLLLQGSINYEHLPTAAENSPIVEETGLWSASIGLAYNADLFQARKVSASGSSELPFSVRIGAFYDTVSSQFRRDSADGTTGDTIDLEDLLDADDRSVVAQFDIQARFGTYHRLELGIFELGRDSSATLGRDYDVGDTSFLEGTEVSLSTRFTSARLSYVYSLLKDSQKEVGLVAGLHQSRIRATVESNPGDREKIDAAATLPVIGIHASVALGENTELAARAHIFRLDFDRYDGVLNYANIELTRRLASRFSIGLGYTLYGQRLSSTNEELRGNLRVRHSGFTLSFGWGF